MSYSLSCGFHSTARCFCFCFFLFLSFVRGKILSICFYSLAQPLCVHVNRLSHVEWVYSATSFMPPSGPVCLHWLDIYFYRIDVIRRENAFRACIQSIRCQLWCIFSPAQLHWLPNASQINHKMFIEPRSSGISWWSACILAPSMHHIALSAATFQQLARKLACGRLSHWPNGWKCIFSLSQWNAQMSKGFTFQLLSGIIRISFITMTEALYQSRSIPLYRRVRNANKMRAACTALLLAVAEIILRSSIGPHVVRTKSKTSVTLRTTSQTNERERELCRSACHAA